MLFVSVQCLCCFLPCSLCKQTSIATTWQHNPHVYVDLCVHTIIPGNLYSWLSDFDTVQVGYLINDIGEFGKPADLRRDAKALAAQLQNIVCKYGGAQYRALQQQGMKRDTSWDLPAEEWEQVNTHHSFLCLHLIFLSILFSEPLQVVSQP